MSLLQVPWCPFELITPNTLNPNANLKLNRQVIANVAEAQEEDVDRAVAAARRAFDYGPWPKMSGRARGYHIRVMGLWIRGLRIT